MRRFATWRLAAACTLAMLPLTAMCAPTGTIQRGDAAVYPYPGFHESDKPIVCTIPPGTPVEELETAPLLDGAGALILPAYFVRVTVLGGECSGRTGWVTSQHFGRP